MGLCGHPRKQNLAIRVSWCYMNSTFSWQGSLPSRIVFAEEIALDISSISTPSGRFPDASRELQLGSSLSPICFACFQHPKSLQSSFLIRMMKQTCADVHFAIHLFLSFAGASWGSPTASSSCVPSPISAAIRNVTVANQGSNGIARGLALSIGTPAKEFAFLPHRLVLSYNCSLLRMLSSPCPVSTTAWSMIKPTYAMSPTSV